MKLYVGFHCRIQDALKKNIKRDKQVSQNDHVFSVYIRCTGVRKLVSTSGIVSSIMVSQKPWGGVPIKSGLFTTSVL